MDMHFIILRRLHPLQQRLKRFRGDVKGIRRHISVSGMPYISHISGDMERDSFFVSLQFVLQLMASSDAIEK